VAREIVIIAAVAANGVIGRGSDLVWRSPADMARFKTATLGRTVIMGRKTWESLPPRFRPLPGRRNIVVTRQPNYPAPGAELAPSLPAALERAGDGDVFVIGGGELYAQALPLADRLMLTKVDFTPEGDTYFPDFSATDWRETERSHQMDAAGIGFDFVTYRRIQRTQST
jgi:dihydrofolate reductase